jgi:hypothetical protein
MRRYFEHSQANLERQIHETMQLQKSIGKIKIRAAVEQQEQLTTATPDDPVRVGFDSEKSS